MKILSEKATMLRTRILRFNILLGLIVLMTAFFLMMTGEYSTLAERQQADRAYNYIMIGSLLYMATVWFGCVFTKPFWKSKSQ
ncbi:MAG: hypothetical protein OEY11_04765 [Gammaproteobacteria bacterium]|nr:hypothetical protein [Gammaproteobacteria bacterium]